MQITCDCLNIVISSAATEYSSSETFKECLPNNNFFKEDVAHLCLCSITIQVPSLIKAKDIGDWKVVTCINCGQACYSTSKNLALDSVIVKRNLENLFQLVNSMPPRIQRVVKAKEKETSQVNALKQSDIYSPIFKILIYDNNIALESDFDLKTSLYPAALTWLSEQTARTEEKIKTFTEKEYVVLDDMRKRAYKDQLAIIRKEMDSLKENNRNDSVEDITETIKVTSISQSLQKSADIFDTSLDAEGVFLLEEFENTGYERKKYGSDSEGSDIETDPYVSRKLGISQLAKSLPIPVPQFMEDRHHNDPASGSPQVPSDIAASIRALAKSVHGDAIFGELPRPRFSTHL